MLREHGGRGRVRKGFIGREDWPRLTNAAGRRRTLRSSLMILRAPRPSKSGQGAPVKKEHGGLSLIV
jgi:hypothetical protein